jgi:hypothetical protein
MRAGLAVSLAIGMCVPAALRAQAVAREVAGTHTVSRESGPAPLANAWVVLHRVAPDTAGPLDSVRTSPTGGFRFRWQEVPTDGVFVFVSSVHHGIAYFSSPVRDAVARDGAADIVAFDTSSAGPPIVVRGRHVIVQRGGGSDRRTVVEVYEIENTGPTTRVSPEAGATFTTVLPAGAESPTAGRGDIAADAIHFANGRVRVNAPIAPGLRQLAISYTVPLTAFPLTFAVPVRTAVLEVLAEDSSAVASGGGLKEQERVSIEGRRLRRWLAQDVPAGSDVTVGGIGGRSSALWIAGLAAGVAALAGLAARARRTSRADDLPVADRGAPLASVGLRGLAAARGDAAEQLAKQIADLDAAWERQSAPSDEAKAAYQARRAELKAELSDRLAAREKPR